MTESEKAARSSRNLQAQELAKANEFCSECGTSLTAQEGHMCSVCYREPTRSEDA
jgi:predicted amidophosphoribosyltransferase